MSVSLLEQLAAGEAPGLVPLTVEQYHQMIRGGILPECAPIELIDGLLVWKDRSALGAPQMSHDPRHAATITRLQHLERRLDLSRHHVRIQLPVTLSDTSEPEPDAAVVQGPQESFVERHPGPADLAAVMEVAHSSLSFDRTTKQQKYAQAGIGQYWIIHLPKERIEVYSDPVPVEGRYARREDYATGQTVPLRLDASQTLEVAVADVLPG